MSLSGPAMAQAICAQLNITNPVVISQYTIFCDALVAYLVANTQLTVPALGITAPDGACTGVSTTGNIS